MKNLMFLIVFLIFSGLACVFPNSKPIEKPIQEKTFEIPTFTPTITVALTKIAVTNVEIGLNIREDSNEESVSLGVIPPNTEVEILGNLLQNGWIYVKWESISGYVNSRYIIFK